MRVYYGTEDAAVALTNTVITVGSFDGVHTGHKLIIDKLKHIADDISGQSVIVTFHPHPRIVLFPEEKDLLLIYTLDEKIDLLSNTGLDNLVIIPFSLQFSRTTSFDFVSKILYSKLGAKVLVVGQNHQFGFNRSGNLDYLGQLGSQLGFKVDYIPTKTIGNETVSSTKIRKALIDGNINLANKFLGHQYLITGRLQKTSQSFDIDNVEVYETIVHEHFKLIVAPGIYVTKLVSGTYNVQSITIITDDKHYNTRTVYTIALQMPNNLETHNATIYYYDKIFGQEQFVENFPGNEIVSSAIRIAKTHKY